MCRSKCVKSVFICNYFLECVLQTFSRWPYVCLLYYYIINQFKFLLWKCNNNCDYCMAVVMGIAFATKSTLHKLINTVTLESLRYDELVQRMNVMEFLLLPFYRRRVITTSVITPFSTKNILVLHMAVSNNRTTQLKIDYHAHSFVDTRTKLETIYPRAVVSDHWVGERVRVTTF